MPNDLYGVFIEETGLSSGDPYIRRGEGRGGIGLIGVDGLAVVTPHVSAMR